MPREKWTEAAPERKLEVLLATIGDACTVSESAQQVMTLTRAGDVNLFAVVDAVMKDPQLATELLRLANSPLFGQTRKVHDLKRAVVVVGMQELHNIAAAMSMMAAFSTPEALSSRFRETAVLTAAAARLLARYYRTVDESEAFLSGLLSEIGAMACIAVDSKKYAEIWHAANGDFERRAALERERYVVQSEVIGAHVLRSNQLPEAVVDAVGATESNAEELLSAITRYARQVTPLIIKAASEGEREVLTETIPALIGTVGLPEIPKELLIKICIQAATLAELSLRGELSLAEEENSEADQAAHPQFSDPAAFDINEIALQETEARKTLAFETVNAVKASPVRFVGTGKSRGRGAWLVVFVVVLSILGVGAAVWHFYLH